MSKLELLKKQAQENNKNSTVSREKEKQNASHFNLFSRNSKKIHPVGLPRACSTLSLSSLSLSLSQNSTDSSLTDNSISLDQKISFALRLIAPVRKKESPTSKFAENYDTDITMGDEGPRRCNWITRNSDKAYVQFHDECWGIPVYDDKQLFELLAMCGMLMDFNWTEIIKRRQLLREAFGGFDPNIVSKMGEKEMSDVSSNKELNLAESRVLCIVDNAKCITKVGEECGSFSNYMWEYVSYKPVINKFKHPRNVPLRSSKAEVISKDMVRRGFRFVGPVIVYSFMQAAGMTIDHLVDCFRYAECVNLAERPWRHV